MTTNDQQSPVRLQPVVIPPFVKFKDGVIKLRDVHGTMFTWLNDDLALQLLAELSEAVRRRYNDPSSATRHTETHK